jgi:hypothetical protein
VGKEVIGESVENCRLFGAEETLVDLIDGLLQLGVTLIVLPRVVPTAREGDVVYIASTKSCT